MDEIKLNAMKIEALAACLEESFNTDGELFRYGELLAMLVKEKAVTIAETCE